MPRLALSEREIKWSETFRKGNKEKLNFRNNNQSGIKLWKRKISGTKVLNFLKGNKEELNFRTIDKVELNFEKEK